MEGTETLCVYGNCKPVQLPATIDRTLVMSRSAVRVRSSVPFLPAKPVKTEYLRPEHRGLCLQYVSSRLPSQGLVPRVGVVQMVAGHRAGGVGGPSGMDRLTDVPGFRRTRHPRKAPSECLGDRVCELRLIGLLRSSGLPFGWCISRPPWN